MKRKRVLVILVLLAGLLAWSAPAHALPLPLPEILVDPDILLPHLEPDMLDLFSSLIEVDIPDDSLRDAVCDLLGIPHGDPITRGDMASTPLEGALELTGIGIKNLEGMQYAINMQSLDVSGNPIEKAPEEMADLDNLIYLRLADCSLTEVPDNVWKLTQLKHLYLNQNQLTSLPADIGDMAQLVTLVLDDNQLGGLPDQLGSLTNLEALSASCNGIGHLPEPIKNCTSLRELYLIGNQMEEIPDWIGSLTNLEVLVADGNRIRSVPGSMASLDAMTALSLGFNKISTFPGFLSGMGSLDALYLTANDIKELPSDLPDWSLSHIDLEWNDLDLDDHAIGSVLDGMETRGIDALVIPQKPVPALTADTNTQGVVKLQWPLITDTYASTYTYTIEGLKLQRKTGDGDYATIAEMDAGATGYEDGDIEPDNTYTYKITARYKTDTEYFSYATYRVATCDAEVAPAAVVQEESAQPAPQESVMPEETGREAGQEAKAVPTKSSPSTGLLIGLGGVLVLLLGVTITLVLVLVKRKKSVLPLPAAEAGPGAVPAKPDKETPNKIVPEQNKGPDDTV